MISRRAFAAGAVGTFAAPRVSFGQSGHPAAVFYASVGPELTLYHPDFEKMTLTKQSTILLSANVQYAWRHPSAPRLYVVSSNGGPGVPGDKHCATAFAIDPKTGALQQQGQSAALRSRPIHVSVDNAGAYVL